MLLLLSYKGIGEEIQKIDNQLTKKRETVHIFGWYMRKYIDETEAKGAIAILWTNLGEA